MVVSAFLSPGEKTVAQRVMASEHGVMVLMEPEGFGPGFKPHGRLFDLCAQGRLLVLRRLSADWHERWGDPLLAVETFVDESLYRGTCYRACGFEALGATAGFGRSARDFYEAHGRRGRGLRHTQSFSLSCAAIAVLMGAGGYQSTAETCAAFTQRQLRALGARRNRDGRFAAPSDSTFYRVLSRVDTATFDAIVGGWLREQDPSEVERIAIEKKSNEIPAFPELVGALPDFDHAVITTDAMHCQQESARVLTRERGWDYVFGLKGNQNGILDRAQRLLKRQAFPP